MTRTKYPHLICIAGRPVEYRSRDLRHYRIERVPFILTAARVMTTVAQVVVVGGTLLAILYGIYVLDIVVQP